MSVARQAAGAARRLAGFGRLALAVGLLAALWVSTVNTVEFASRDADQKRASDRSAVAAGFAASLRDWVDAGRTEAVTLSHSVGAVGPSNANGAIASFLNRPRTFSRDALVFSGSTVVAASGRYNVLVGLRPRPCRRVDESGATVTETGLDQLVGAPRNDGPPVVSPIFDVPGDCLPGAGIAVASGSTVTVVLGHVEDATARLAAGSMINDVLPLNPSSSGAKSVPAGGTRILLVTRDLSLEPREGAVTITPRVAAFVRHAGAGGSHLTRYSIGTGADAQVLAAYAPVTAGWSVVLEQDAAAFDIEPQNRPSVIVASALTLVFAIVFALLAFFDLRRKRAHRRTDVAKNTFFSIAGHELRTPLTVIKGFAEMLSSHWEEVNEDRRRSLVERIVPQTRRLDRLVERLLVAASIQADTHTRPQVRGVDLRPLLEQVAEQFRPEAPLHEFLVRVEPEANAVAADPAALDQVLQHLVDNAVKYSPSGGRVWLRAVSDRRRIYVVVEDEGVGLPSDHRHIFDKFVQGESVTKRVHDEGGVGLGLYIVRTLVEQMRGSVFAEPRQAGGARFIVALKPAPPPASTPVARRDVVELDRASPFGP